jgi:glucuronate isomerase
MKYKRMKTFITDDFLLNNKAAKNLYHDYAKNLPIIDYHNHLSPKYVANNRKFENITEAWLEGDHYKWRAMRALGVNEAYITGNASDEEKFKKWAEVVKLTIRNPLYHWTHLELLRYFNIDNLLTENNATNVYQQTFEQLQQTSHSTRGLLAQQKVEAICTTDDPTDDLIYHKGYAAEGESLIMSMAFRPDNAFAVEGAEAYLVYLEKLEEVTGKSIDSFDDLLEALDNRIDYFHENGCRLSDHGLAYLPYSESGTYNIENIFKSLKAKKELSSQEIDYFKCQTLMHLCKSYHKKGWVQQFHLGPLRNVNSRLAKKIGKDAGLDSMGDFPQAVTLAKFLDYLDKTDQLTKTILYNLNPAQNEVFASMTGNFQDGSLKGKIQYGSGWWFLDQKDGIEKQLNALSNMGMVSTFIGMLTDSRSFLSFPRHEYFRRVLCNLFGDEVEKGLLPNDVPYLGNIIKDICYHNAADYFSFKVANPEKLHPNGKTIENV